MSCLKLMKLMNNDINNVMDACNASSSLFLKKRSILACFLSKQL